MKILQILALIMFFTPIAVAWQIYDRNSDGAISDEELITAIMDWLNCKINDYQLIEVIIKWLEKPAEETLEFGVKYSSKVISIVDGDTIDVSILGRIERVRLLGIDSPETIANENKPYEFDGITDLQCLASWGIKAKQFALGNLLDRDVYIEFDEFAGFKDYYGRLLAYIYLENFTDFNAELVKLGYARVYVEGDFAKEKEYLKYQQQAINASLGLWSCKEGLPTSGDVRIIYVHYDAYGDDNYNLNDEYVVIKNFDSIPINLAGWALKDQIGHTYVFPQFIIQPGASVKIHSGCGIDKITDLYWCSQRAIWNNDHDTAYLYDSYGNLVYYYWW